MSEALNILLLIVVGIIAFGFLISVAAIQKQKKKELDKGIDPQHVKHMVRSNPIFLAYIATPILVAIGAAITFYLLR